MIPIRIRQFPSFLKSTIKREKVLLKPAVVSKTFILCFFSCHSYFRYLYCSLHSLTRHIKSVQYKVFIFNDEDQPISVAQISVIQKLLPEVRVITWPKSMGWGSKQIGSIWDAYGLASHEAKDDDVIARVDSDVFFFNDTIFKAVSQSDADLVGDGHFVDFKYCQGGCYFFKVEAVRKINKMISSDGINTLLKGIDVVVEDVAAYNFAKKLGLKIWLTWFMMFPDELKNAGSLTPWYRWKFSCLHFIMKNKIAMLDAYEREILKGNSSTPYRQALDTE